MRVQVTVPYRRDLIASDGFGALASAPSAAKPHAFCLDASTHWRAESAGTAQARKPSGRGVRALRLIRKIAP